MVQSIVYAIVPKDNIPGIYPIVRILCHGARLEDPKTLYVESRERDNILTRSVRLSQIVAK